MCKFHSAADLIYHIRASIEGAFWPVHPFRVTRSEHLLALQALQRAAVLRSGAAWIPEASFLRRRAFFTDKVRSVIFEYM